MPYEAFNDPERYVSDTPKKKTVPRHRKIKPRAEWSVKDVVTEFRQQYHLKYPMHSPDDLGNFQRVCAILGKLRKDDGVTILQMIDAIDVFFKKKMAERYPEYPAWKKYLWVVRDQRDRNPEVHRNTMKKSFREGATRETALTLEQLKAGNPEEVQARRAERALARKRQELEHWLDEQRRHGDWLLEEELGPNWATIIRELMKEVGYERSDESPSGPA